MAASDRPLCPPELVLALEVLQTHCEWMKGRRITITQYEANVDGVRLEKTGLMVTLETLEATYRSYAHGGVPRTETIPKNATHDALCRLSRYFEAEKSGAGGV